MPNDLDYVKHMMPPHRDHPWSGFGDLVAKPVGREPQIPDWSPENFDCYAATAEACARTTFGMVDEPRLMGKHPLLAAPYGSRIAYDRRCYLVGTLTIALGLVVMLAVGAYLVHRGWPRHAASHIAVNDANDSWCLGFDGLSCKQQDAARE